MAELECPNIECTGAGADIAVRYICHPCNTLAGTGRTVWNIRVPTGEPAAEACPACTALRGPAWFTCSKCGSVWPPAAPVAGVLERGRGLGPEKVAENRKKQEEAAKKGDAGK